jgi:hypothetical protein
LVCRRKDFFGRALLFHIEHLFEPVEQNEQESDESAGVSLPRHITPGLLEEIKAASGKELIKGYERVFAIKSERYRSRKDSMVDLVAFANNGTVRAIASGIIRKFKSEFRKKGENEGKDWLISAIEQSPSFKGLKRNLTESEYRALREALFVL